MTAMKQEEAFALNEFVESKSVMEPTINFENFFPTEVLENLKQIAKDHIELPDTLPSDGRLFWFRKGSIHRNQYIQKISKEYVEPLLSNKNAELIGDTAFCINHPPHDIHVDSRDFRTNLNSTKKMIGYKTVVIPLEIDTDDYPYLFTTNQYFFGPSTRFRKGYKDLTELSPETARQKQNGVYFSYNYEEDGVKFLSDVQLSKEWYDRYIDYDIGTPWAVPYCNFEGFSIEKENQWKPNNLIMFDSSRIHFGELISKRNATFKLGISLNYGIEIS